MQTYPDKLSLIRDRARTLFYVEQPHGLTAFDLNEREPKPIVTEDGQKAHDLLTIDMQTSNCIRVIAEGLNEKNRQEFLSWSWASIGEWAWKLYGMRKTA